MELRTAEKSDLPALKVMFEKIVEKMRQNRLFIWNEVYPFEEFADDIEKRNLYLLTDQDEILAAFGVYDATNGQDCFEWKDKNAKAVYLVRLGVNVPYLKQGIGTVVLKHAEEIAKQKNAKAFRLLVSDDNETAINFYRKNGFTEVKGEYYEFSESLNATIREIGFEKGC